MWGMKDDDGSVGDAVANDGIYSATIPAGVAQPGEMLRWKIETTDTAGAIAGSLMGMEVGDVGIPVEWRERLMLWPVSRRWIRRVSTAMHTGRPDGATGINWWRQFAKNLVMIPVVLAHGMMRFVR